jgi:hypothetical protein
VKLLRVVVSVLLLITLLSACGGENGNDTALETVPTRTAPPAASVDAQDADAPYRIVSLREPVAGFFAADVGVLDQSGEFLQRMINAGSPCFTESLNPGEQFQVLYDLRYLNFPMLDLDPWITAEAVFPEAELTQAVAAVLDGLADMLPQDRVLGVCLIPVPHITMPEHPGVDWRESSPRVTALDDLTVFAQDGATLIVACASESCVEEVPVAVTRAVAVAWQLDRAYSDLAGLPMDQRMIVEARADVFTLTRYPEAVLPWRAIDPNEDRLLNTWLWIGNALEDPNAVLALTHNLLYGERIWDDGVFQVWGGMYLGGQIVDAYTASHPDLAWEDLAALDAKTIIVDSGIVREVGSVSP